MKRFVLELLGTILALFIAVWIIVHLTERILFHTHSDVAASGSLREPLQHPGVDCDGSLFSDDPVTYHITTTGKLVVRCPVRLFPIAEKHHIEDPPDHVIDLLIEEHRSHLSSSDERGDSN